MTEVLRLAAFTRDPRGGNPAGVWIGDAHPGDGEMQRIAASVGYSETVFLRPLSANGWSVRYFSPLAEVPFCGHATIAAGVVLGERFGEGSYVFATSAGDVTVRVARDHADGVTTATLISVPPRHRAAPPALLDDALRLLGWAPDELDSSIPPALANAGAWHLVIAAATRRRLADLRYDVPALRTLMHEFDLTTLQLIWREDTITFHARNPFPVGGVVEDPATGAAAAALGGYLRDGGLIRAPSRIDIHQGDDMGRPSRIRVDIPLAGGISVSGTAVRI